MISRKSAIPQQRPSAIQSDQLHSEINLLKAELLNLYEENLAYKEQQKIWQQDKELLHECEAEIARLKILLKDMEEQKKNVPTERQQIKDRIIMKLEDELITVRIALKEALLRNG